MLQQRDDQADRQARAHAVGAEAEQGTEQALLQAEQAQGHAAEHGRNQQAATLTETPRQRQGQRATQQQRQRQRTEEQATAHLGEHQRLLGETRQHHLNRPHGQIDQHRREQCLRQQRRAQGIGEPLADTRQHMALAAQRRHPEAQQQCAGEHEQRQTAGLNRRPAALGAGQCQQQRRQAETKHHQGIEQHRQLGLTLTGQTTEQSHARRCQQRPADAGTSGTEQVEGHAPVLAAAGRHQPEQGGEEGAVGDLRDALRRMLVAPGAGRPAEQQRHTEAQGQSPAPARASRPQTSWA